VGDGVVVVVARPPGAVVVVDVGAVVVVVFGAVVVVVVACPPGELDVVELLVLVVELGLLAVVELGFVVVVVVVDVDVVVDAPDVGATETPPVSRLDPTTDDSGFPASSSMHVTTTNATTKTTAVDATSTGHRIRHLGSPDPRLDGAGGTGRPGGTAPIVSVRASARPSVSVGCPAGPTASVTDSPEPATSAVASGAPIVSVARNVSSVAAPPVVVSAAGPLAVPAVPVSPNRRRIGASGFLTAA
jgi:hypothetical protein